MLHTYHVTLMIPHIFSDSGLNYSLYSITRLTEGGDTKRIDKCCKYVRSHVREHDIDKASNKITHKM